MKLLITIPCGDIKVTDISNVISVKGSLSSKHYIANHVYSNEHLDQVYYRQIYVYNSNWLTNFSPTVEFCWSSHLIDSSLKVFLKV